VFRFAYPFAFLLLIPLGAAAWFVYRRRVRQALVFSPLHRIPRTGASTVRLVAATVMPAVFLAGTALCILALARPQRVLSSSRRTSDVIAIQMVIDVSGSMQALDLSTRTAAGTDFKTRLDAVKDTFADFVRRRPDDLIGLVTFGGYASTRAPLTADHPALLHSLKGVEIPRPAQKPDGTIADREELMTAVGDALATACARLETAEAKSRIVVLLSDGESNTGIIRPKDAAEAAKKLGIKVYTIGVGTNGRAPFKGRDMFGREVIEWANVTLDEELLRDIAATTGGRYFNVRDPKGLEETVEAIDKLEKTEVGRTVYEQYDELFCAFLFPGMAVLMAGLAANALVAGRLL